MKRKLIATLLCLAISLLMVACGSKDNSTKTDNNVKADATTETAEATDAGVEAFWDKVGIVDGTGNVYNGETVEMDDSSAMYEFEEYGDYLQFVETEISYKNVNIKLWAQEYRKERISISGDYELEKIQNPNTSAISYNINVDGKSIAQINLSEYNEGDPVENCELNRFELYPTEGLVFNGFEFKDSQMEAVIDYFGNPNNVVFSINDEEEQKIVYTYTETIYKKLLASFDGIGETPGVSFRTNDGKNIETISINLVLSKEEVIAQRESLQRVQEKEKEYNELDMDEYEELVSDPVDGRDGSMENPYHVGDTIYFPKVAIGYNYESLEYEYSPLKIVVQEATSEYVKISYEFGRAIIEDVDMDEFAYGAPEYWSDMTGQIFTGRFNKDLEQVGTQLEISRTLNNESDLYNYVFDGNEIVLYLQDFDGKGCIEGTDYIMLIYGDFSIPEDEHYPYFNCTFIEVTNP